MGTRSLTVVKDKDDKEIMVMYRQFDGYPEGMGQDLATYLKAHKLVNGIGLGATWKNAFNGPCCMAASIVSQFKDDIGGIYLYPAETRGCGEEYVYTVYSVGEQIKLMCKDVGDKKILFDGTPEDYLTWLKKYLGKPEVE